MTLSKDEIVQIAYGEGMRNSELFVEFMKKRFPDEGHKPYVREWAGRFLSGDPTPYMDTKSLKDFIDTIKKLRRVV